MSENKMRQEIHQAMDTCLSGVQPDSFLVQRVLKNEKTTEKRKPSRSLAIAAGLALVAAAVVLIAGNVLPIWPDTRNAAQVADSPANTAQENTAGIVGQSFELGSVTFTVLEQYADPYAAMVTVRVSLPEGEKGLLNADALQTIDPETADRLGVYRGMTWVTAAKQLNLPLYRIRVMLFDTAQDLSLYGSNRVEEQEDGSVTVYTAAFLDGDAGDLPETVALWLTAWQVDTDDPSNLMNRQSQRIEVPLRFETVSASASYAIPDGQAGSTRVMYNDWDDAHQQTVTHEARMTFTPTAAQANLTPAGLYVKVEYRVAEEITLSPDAYTTGLKAEIIGADGEVLPAGLIRALPMDISAWPMVSFTCMVDADSIPETMTFRLQNLVKGQFETVLETELTK